MEKKKSMWLVSGAALAILIGAIFLFSQGVPDDGKRAGSQTQRQWQPGENGRPPMMNMSEEERQQLMAARMQLAVAACQDKAENDACTMQSSRGNMTGTCKTREGTLLCSTGMMRGNNWSVNG